MKILYNLQQSVYNDEGQWSRADSNVQMTCDLFRALRNQQSEWWESELECFDVFIAPVSDFFDLDSYDDLFEDEKVNFLSFDRPVDAFTARYDFDVEKWKSALSEGNYDVVINNVTEISRNIKTVLHRVDQEDTKLVSQCFWMDCPRINEAKVDQEISYDWRQFDGYECSDLSVFTCQSTKEAFFRNAEHKFHGDEIFDLKRSSSIWDFGYSVEEAENCRPSEDRLEEITSDKKRVLFLNRLSGINYTHHKEFIQAVNDLYKQRKDFEVVFTNPSKKVDHEELMDWCLPAISYNDGDPLDRSQYWELLYSGDISVHLFMKERYGGCALRESIHAGNVPLVADCHEQRTLVDGDMTILCDETEDEVQPRRIEEALDLWLDRDDFDLGHVRRENRERCSFESTSEDVVNDLMDLVSGS